MMPQGPPAFRRRLALIPPDHRHSIEMFRISRFLTPVLAAAVIVTMTSAVQAQFFFGWGQPSTRQAPARKAPVRQGHRYLNNRLGCLDYPRALALGLPIGSGMIESGHRMCSRPASKRLA